MRQALEARAADELTEPVAQILWLEQGRLVETPPLSQVSLYRVPPADRHIDEVRPIKDPIAVMPVEDAAQSEPATKPRRVEAETVARAEPGLLGMPPVTNAITGGRRRVPTTNLHRGLQWFMRPFARRRRNETPMVDGHDEGDQFALDNLLGQGASATGNEPDAHPVQATAPEAPAVGQESVAPGWYPDPGDANSIRYWDGSHWTELVTPRPPPLAALGEPAATAEAVNLDEPLGGSEPDPSPQVPVASQRDETLPAPIPVSDGAMAEPSGWRSDPFDLHEGRYFDQGQPTNRVRDGSRFFFDDMPKGGSPPQSVGTAWSELPPPPPPPAPPRVGAAPSAAAVAHETPEGHNWAHEAELAVARARTVDTPESWREAVHAALVLADKVQAMLAVADAKQAAEQLAEAARVAAEAAVDAKQTAEQTGQAAREAEQAARVATEAAANAKETAQLAAQAVPQAAHAARVAAEAAADAKHNAQELERTVARASEVNTPEAWREALHVVPGDDGGSDQRDPDSRRELRSSGPSGPRGRRLVK